MKNLKNKLFLTATMLYSLSGFAQDFKNKINTGISNYLLPIVLLILLIGAIYGLAKNWEEINSKQTRMDGLINVAVIVLYAAIFAAVIGAVIYIGSTLDMSI